MNPYTLQLTDAKTGEVVRKNVFAPRDGQIWASYRMRRWARCVGTTSSASCLSLRDFTRLDEPRVGDAFVVRGQLAELLRAENGLGKTWVKWK